jgi:hypothetical protein
MAQAAERECQRGLGCMGILATPRAGVLGPFRVHVYNGGVGHGVGTGVFCDTQGGLLFTATPRGSFRAAAHSNPPTCAHFHSSQH